MIDMPKVVRSLRRCAPMWPIAELHFFLLDPVCSKAFRSSRRIFYLAIDLFKVPF